MTERYMRVSLTFGLSGIVAGENDTLIFNHNHGGQTQEFESPEDAEHGNDVQETSFFHSHSMTADFTSPVNIEPPFSTVKYFMRIQ